MSQWKVAAEPLLAAPRASQLPAVLDPEQWDELADLPDDLRDSVLTAWSVDATTFAADLPELIANGDAASIGKRAHRLRGSSASIGAAALSDVCRILEMRCMEGRPIFPHDAIAVSEQVNVARAAVGNWLA
jgi:hypothetical protein